MGRKSGKPNRDVHSAWLKGEPPDWWNPFERTEEEKTQAREFMLRYVPDGTFEISVCARCGMWTKWDQDLIESGGLKCLVGFDNHLVSRVTVRVL